VRGAPDRRAVVSLAGAGGWALGRRRRQRAARGLPVIAGAAAAAFKLAGRGQTRRRLVPGVADQVDPGTGRRGRRRRRRRRRRRWTEAQGDRAVPEALLPEAAGSSPRDRRPRLRYGLLAPRLLFDWGNLGVYVCVCVCVQSVVLLILAPEMQLHSVISPSAGTNFSAYCFQAFS
jgi:hypothetical protein